MPLLPQPFCDTGAPVGAKLLDKGFNISVGRGSDQRDIPVPAFIQSGKIAQQITRIASDACSPRSSCSPGLTQSCSKYSSSALIDIHLIEHSFLFTKSTAKHLHALLE